MLMCNLGYLTRVFLAPALRESFAMPFLPLQLIIIVYTMQHQHQHQHQHRQQVQQGREEEKGKERQRQHRHNNGRPESKEGNPSNSSTKLPHPLPTPPGWSRWLLIVASTACFAIPWQFAQFALCCEAVALFVVHVVGLTSSKDLRFIVSAIGAGGVITALAHVCNIFMLFSPLTSFAIAVVVATLVEENCKMLHDVVPTSLYRTGDDGVAEHTRNPSRMLSLYRLVVTFMTTGLCLALFESIGGNRDSISSGNGAAETDGAHIGGLLKAKFGLEEPNFHGKLYLCAEAFKFITENELLALTEGMVLPAAVTVIIAVLADLIREAPALHSSRAVAPPDAKGATKQTSGEIHDKDAASVPADTIATAHENLKQNTTAPQSKKRAPSHKKGHNTKASLSSPPLSPFPSPSTSPSRPPEALLASNATAATPEMVFLTALAGLYGIMVRNPELFSYIFHVRHAISRLVGALESAMSRCLSRLLT